MLLVLCIVCFCYVALSQQPVLIAQSHDVQVKTNEVAHLECQFTSSSAYEFCKWQKDDNLLTASKKYNFSTIPHDDPVNPDTVTCSLDVLNVSVDDVGNYFCAVCYNDTFVNNSQIDHEICSDAELAKVQLTISRGITIALIYIYMYLAKYLCILM